MKKITAILLAMVIIFAVSAPILAVGVEKKAITSQTAFFMDGKKITFDSAYEIDGSNYIQLRSVATMLNGTKSQFNVYWDESLRQAVIEPGMPYTGAKPIAQSKDEYGISDEVVFNNVKVTIDEVSVVTSIPGSTITPMKNMVFAKVTFTVFTANYPEGSQYWTPSFFVQKCTTEVGDYGGFFQTVQNDRIYPNQAITITIYYDIPTTEHIKSITVCDGLGERKLVLVK